MIPLKHEHSGPHVDLSRSPSAPPPPGSLARRPLRPEPVSRRPWAPALILALGAAGFQVFAHIVPPETYHPMAASYRRLTFILNLNPIVWSQVRSDAEVIAEHLAEVDPEASGEYLRSVSALLETMASRPDGSGETPTPAERQETARRVFALSTSSVARAIVVYLRAVDPSIRDYSGASRSFLVARQLWKSFEHEIKWTDREAFVRLGRRWLELSGALGGAAVPDGLDAEELRSALSEIIAYVEETYGAEFRPAEARPLGPWPSRSPTYDAQAMARPWLPPESELNKQLPRPRQILNMAARGVDESETALIALGDMAFDSPYIFGEPARGLGVSCNTCHNKGVTNPKLFIPGLSSVAGGIDVSNAFFARHANNGLYDPLDVPDLRGIRFTAPYGRNGRFASLREFTRNVIVNEFKGPEPDPVVLDAMVAYMNEFDFLPNPLLAPDGRLRPEAPEAARRGEALFNRPFETMGGRSCAACHVPSDHFLDRRRHDIGSVPGATPHARDGALDTPTLLSSLYTAPYFHDGSLPTLEAVVRWFDGRFGLGLREREIADLTAYLEAVGGGVEAYEETLHTLEAELEEFSFFLSSYEFLKGIEKPGIISALFLTVATEIHAHKWDVQDEARLPDLDRLAELMEDAYLAEERGDREAADRLVEEYRTFYAARAEWLK